MRPLIRPLFVSQLQGTTHSKAFELLKLFAYGTWTDYTGVANRRPALLYVHRQPLHSGPTVLIRTVENKMPARSNFPFNLPLSAADSSKYSSLSPQHERKLKLLTILTMADSRRVRPHFSF